MNFEHAQNRSDLLHLGTRIKAQLQPFSRMQIDVSVGTGRIDGFLNLSHDDIQTAICARCSFEFVVDWINRVPVVSTNDAWLRRGGADWHVYRDGSLCYVYAPQWRDEVAAVLSEHDLGEAASFAASWCLHSVRWLLYRHHFAFEHGIKKWPSEWPFWPHGNKAEIEYKKFKSRRWGLRYAAA
jgi:hypothetical protein